MARLKTHMVVLWRGCHSQMKEEKRGFHLVMDMAWSSGAPMPLSSGATASRDLLFQNTNIGTLVRWYVGTLVRWYDN